MPSRSVALILFVSSGKRSTTITNPSWLLVLPLVSCTEVAFSDGLLRNVMADTSREVTEIISLKLRVTVLLFRSSSKASSSGGCTSSTKSTAGLAAFDGTGRRGFPDVSFANSSVKDTQQLLISEHSPLSRWISRRSDKVSLKVTLVLSLVSTSPPVRVKDIWGM